MKIAYLQCPTGIAGDMCLGALVDVGVPVEYLTEQLGRLGVSQEYKLWTEEVHRNGQRATKFHVDLLFAGESVNPDKFNTFDHAAHPHPIHSATNDTESIAPSAQPHYPSHDHPHSHPSHPAQERGENQSPPVRHLPEIEQLILNAGLPPRAEAWSLAVFRQLGAAEGAVHGLPPERVHFHEVGATDALIDIIGTCLGLDWLGVDRIYCSPLPTGGGTVRAAHGRLPVPTPAVLKLFQLRQIPIYSNGIDRELVTPTGAAIATTLADQFGAPPTMILHRVGLGAGSQNLTIPNILRLWIGEEGQGERQKDEGRRMKAKGTQSSVLSPQSLVFLTPHSPLPTPHFPVLEEITVLETQIDDLNPQAIGYVLERLLESGALDVFTGAIAMKKSRPGVLLTVVCRPEDVERCEAIVFWETTTLGIRRSVQQRQILPREIQSVQTEHGTVRVKVAWAAGRDRPPTHVQPEYEDCAQIAREQGLALRDVQRSTLQSWYLQFQ